MSDDPVELISAGISNSGVGGLLATSLVDLSMMFYNDRTRRYGGQSVSDIIFGPSAATVKDVGQVMFNTAEDIIEGDEMSESDKKRAKRLIPFLNLFYIKALTERLNDEDR